MNLLLDGIANGCVEQTAQSVKLYVDGTQKIYPIYRVRLDQLYFNDQNDRIATWISRYKADHGITELSRDNIEDYNAIIHECIRQSNPERLNETQVNIKLIGQQKYGVVLNDGRIIDGNRRYTCLRNLAKESESFNYFETIILEKDYYKSAKQIKMLELQIQLGEDKSVDYNPIDRLVGIYRDLEQNKLLSEDEYARSVNQKVSEVRKELEISKLLIEFLEAINAPHQYYIARELELNGPLVELYGILKKLDDEKKQEVKMAAFANFVAQPIDDMTRFIRKIKTIINNNHIDEFIEKENEVVEKIFDDLPPLGKVNSETVAKIKGDENIKAKLEQIMDVVDNKSKATETKNKPNQILAKVADSVDEIDVFVLKKLDEEQVEEISTNLDRIYKKLDEIKGVLNV